MYRYIVHGWVLYYNIRQVPTYVCCRCKRRARKYDNGRDILARSPSSRCYGGGVVASLILTCTYITIQLGTRSAAEKRIHQGNIGLSILLLLSLYTDILYMILLK